MYRLSPDLATMTLLVKDFLIPNGLAFSPDEKVLYINDTRRGHIRAFQVTPNGGLDLGSDRVFAELRGERAGSPDGMKTDAAGNVYCTGPGGVWIFDTSGKHLGVVNTGEGEPAINMAFGGDDWKTLFITTFHTLKRVRLNIAGVPVPPRRAPIIASNRGANP